MLRNLIVLGYKTARSFVAIRDILVSDLISYAMFVELESFCLSLILLLIEWTRFKGLTFDRWNLLFLGYIRSGTHRI